MPRLKTHKFAVQVKGLTDDQAAQLHFLLLSCAAAMVGGDADRFDTVGNVAVKKLREAYPDTEWRSATAKERIALVS